MAIRALGTLTERRGGWITTASGRNVYLADPRPEDIDVEDIAHALSHLCHWVGHARRFISIAEHSVLVSHQFGHPGEALWGLLHDAPEAYLGDVSRPLKRMLPEYSRLEALWMAAIRDAIHLPHSEPPDLKRADNAVLMAEAEQLMPNPDDYREHFGAPADARVESWDHEYARWRFLQRYQDLQAFWRGMR